MQWVPFWVIPLLVCFSVATVWLRLAVVRTTYGVDEADQRIRNAKREIQNLNLKIASLRSPRRLEKLAARKFELRRPRVDQVIHLQGIKN